jgi:CRP/FNR family transcriptional regulator, cyclic AMP receptor protein
MSGDLPDDQHRAVLDITALATLFPGLGLEPVVEIGSTARQLKCSPDETLYSADQPARVGIVVSGLLRTAIAFRNGRRATIDYTGPGGFYGLATLFHPVALNVEAVRTSVVIEIDPATIARVAAEFPQLRWFIAQQLASAALRMPSLIEEFAFKTVRQRVAGHLLALSTPRAADQLLEVRVTQEALADSVGSVREVVSRSLGSLRKEGLIAIGVGAITVLNAEALQEASS